MKVAVVIPARYGSKRLVGKPLINICGKTLINRVYLQVEKCKKIDDIVVATDDQRIVNEVESFGGKALLTSPDHISGTDRVYEVAQKLEHDYIVNVQGDEPLINEILIDEVAEVLKKNDSEVVSAYFVNSNQQDFLSENCVKLVKSENNEALYFSRSPIPFLRNTEFKSFNHHIGIYGYSIKALEKFVNSPPGRYEIAEKLEQLRFLEKGISIKMVKTDSRSQGVDVEEDLERVKKIINEIHD